MSILAKAILEAKARGFNIRKATEGFKFSAKVKGEAVTIKDKGSFCEQDLRRLQSHSGTVELLNERAAVSTSEKTEDGRAYSTGVDGEIAAYWYAAKYIGESAAERFADGVLAKPETPETVVQTPETPETVVQTPETPKRRKSKAETRAEGSIPAPSANGQHS